MNAFPGNEFRPNSNSSEISDGIPMEIVTRVEVEDSPTILLSNLTTKRTPNGFLTTG